MSALRRLWIPLLVVGIIVVAGFCVDRIKGFFGSQGTLVTPRDSSDLADPFNPKVVTYTIFGDPGAYADINYVDLDARPQRVDAARLPWQLVLRTTAPAASPNIVAQGDGSRITCRITVDDTVKDERTSNGVNAQTFCLVKSA